MTLKLKMLAVAIAGTLIYSCSPKIITPAVEVKKELTPELAEGKGLYENNCAKCHKLFEPTRHTKEDWIPVVDRMAKKAKITEAQKVLVYNYIVSEL